MNTNTNTALMMLVSQTLSAIDEAKQSKESGSDQFTTDQMKAQALISATAMAFVIYTGNENAEATAWGWFTDYTNETDLVGPSTAIKTILDDMGWTLKAGQPSN